MHDESEERRGAKRRARAAPTAPAGLSHLGPQGIALLRVVPLLHVAWLMREELLADDRRALLQLARRHGVEAGSAADRLLRGWLEERPSEEFFASCLVELKSRLADLPPEEQAASKTDLVAYIMTIDRLAIDVRSRRAIVGVSSRPPRDRDVASRREAAVHPPHRRVG